MACWAWARQLLPHFRVILALSFLSPICRAGTIPSGLQGWGEDALRICPEVPKESDCPHDGLPRIRQWTEGPLRVALVTMERLTGCDRLKIKNKAKIWDFWRILFLVLPLGCWGKGGRGLPAVPPSSPKLKKRKGKQKRQERKGKEKRKRKERNFPELSHSSLACCCKVWNSILCLLSSSARFHSYPDSRDWPWAHHNPSLRVSLAEMKHSFSL